MDRRELAAAVNDALFGLLPLFRDGAPVAARHKALRDLIRLCRSPISMEESERQVLHIYELAARRVLGRKYRKFDAETIADFQSAANAVEAYGPKRGLGLASPRPPSLHRSGPRER